MEIYVREREEEKAELDEIFCCTREDLIAGMMKVLPKGCVIRGSQVLAIKSDGNAKKTEVTAVKVNIASGQEVWLRSRLLDQDEGFDYVFGADGVHSVLATQLNPGMARQPGGTTNTVVTCLKDEGLAQQLGTRFIKRSKTKGKCCAVGMLSPARGIALLFMQFSTALHGTAPYMRPEIRSFIHGVVGLPSVPGASEPDNICLLPGHSLGTTLIFTYGASCQVATRHKVTASLARFWAMPCTQCQTSAAKGHLLL